MQQTAKLNGVTADATVSRARTEEASIASQKMCDFSAFWTPVQIARWMWRKHRDLVESEVIPEVYAGQIREVLLEDGDALEDLFDDQMPTDIFATDYLDKLPQRAR
jgi:hypothetical protein